ncbi:phage tail termination protein [Streptomyces sp. NPDC004376]
MTALIDIEGELIPRAQARWPDAVVRDELDNNLLDELPTIQVLQLPGGGDDGLLVARMLVDVNVYAPTRADAFELAIEVHDWITRVVRGSTSSTLVIGLVRCLSLPAERPYENTALRRAGGTYEIFCHPVS